MVMNPPTYARDMGLTPDPRRSHMPRAPQLLSLCSRAGSHSCEPIKPEHAGVCAPEQGKSPQSEDHVLQAGKEKLLQRQRSSTAKSKHNKQN